MPAGDLSGTCGGALADPRPRSVEIVLVEVADVAGGEEVGQPRHPVLPPLLADHRQPLVVRAVGGVEVEVLPQRIEVVTPGEGVHVAEQAAVAVATASAFDDG